jgi:hypothetical protein
VDTGQQQVSKRHKSGRKGKQKKRVVLHQIRMELQQRITPSLLGKSV